MALVISQMALWMIVLTNLLLTLAIIRRLNAEPARARTGLRAGESAPSFSARTLGGKTLTLADLQRRTALVFVGPGCPPCVDALPEYVRLASIAKSSETDLVIVSGGDDASTRQMLEEAHAIHVDTVIAPRSTNRLFDDYRVSSTPHFILVQGKRVVLTGAPFTAANDWKNLVNSWEQSAPVTPMVRESASPV